MKRYFLLVGLLVLMAQFCCAQNTLDFRQFYFNPFLTNPAYAGHNGKTEFEIVHRQQWLDFEDAPNASGFSFQDPQKKNISIGINFFTQKSVALRTSSIQATVAYAIHLSEKQLIRFALCGGMGINDFDLQGRDYSNDPLILKAAQNSVYPEAGFGALYALGEFRLGITLPTLFNNQEPGSGILRTHPQQHLVNQLYSVRYKFKLKGDMFSLEPYFLYRLNRDLQNYWEAAALLHYKESMWVGSSYHSYNGLAFFLGFTVIENFRIGYDYEAPSTRYTSSSTHEIQMSIRLPDKKTE